MIWVFSASVDEGLIVYKARLVFDVTSQSPRAGVVTFADTARPVAWRTLLHCGAADGAEIVRRDVPNAHQSTELAPEDACYSVTRCAPGLPRYVGNKTGLLLWSKYLNGMPPAARGFSARLDRVLLEFRVDGCGFVPSVVYSRIFILSLPTGEYMYVAVIVDDMAVVTRSEGNRILNSFDEWMEQHWPGMQRRQLHQLRVVGRVRVLSLIHISEPTRPY